MHLLQLIFIPEKNFFNLLIFSFNFHSKILLISVEIVPGTDNSSKCHKQILK